MIEIYISTDIETDGPLPGVNSMLSFASAAFLADKTLLGTFSANLETLPGAIPDPITSAWWQTQAIAWEACRKDLQTPFTAMQNYVQWLKQLNGRLVFVGYPVTFDFMFMHWYLLRFTGSNPFSYAGLDIKTYAMALLKTEYKKAMKANLPGEWFDANYAHTHIALDDAMEQGLLFCNMLAAASKC